MTPAPRTFCWHLDAATSLQGLIDRLASPLQAGATSTRPPAPEERHRLAVVGADAEAVSALRALARQQLLAHGRIDAHEDIFHTDAPLGPPGVALMFPGQGSQHVGMLAEWLPVPEFSASLLELDEVARQVHGRSLKTWFFDAPDLPEHAMTGTHAAQTGLGYACSALARTLTRMGVQAEWAVGHSYGELVALWHAGAYDDATLARLTHERGQAMAQAATQLPGALAAVGADGDAVADCLKAWPELEIANLNAPAQTVVGGPSQVLKDFAQACQQKGWRCALIQGASAAFHTSRMQPALTAWHEHLQGCARRQAFHATSRARVIANLTASPYPIDEQGAADFIANSLHRQVTSQVRWVETCQALYAAGVRLFIEVGPGQVLSKLITQNLAGAPHRVITCSPKGDIPVWQRLARIQAALAIHAALSGPDLRATPLATPLATHPHLPQQDNLTRGLAMKRDTPLIEAFLQENTRIVERYFALMDRVLDTTARQPVADSVLQQMLSDSTRLAHAHLQVHESLLSGTSTGTPATNSPQAAPVGPPHPIAHSQAAEVNADIDLLAWLQQEVSQLTGFAASSIDPQARFDDLGVDSLAFMDIYTRLNQRLAVSEAAAEQVLGARCIADVIQALSATPPAPPTQATSDICEWLKSRVAEATGFASTDIDECAALEDLGIDSLARTDLFEALGQAWPQARQHASALFEARSIQDIVRLLGPVSAHAKASASAPTHATPEPTQVQSREWPPLLQDLKAQLLSNLGPNARQAGVALDESTPFQALSLNSFERARLWGQTALWQAPFKLAGEALISVSSVKEGLELLAHLPLADAPKKKEAAPKSGDRLQRYRHIDVPRQVPGGVNIERLWLVGADTPATSRLAASLREAGTLVQHLVVSEHGWQLPGAEAIALSDVDGLTQAIEPLLAGLGPCTAAFVTQPQDSDGVRLGTDALDAPALALFTLAKALGKASGLTITRLSVLLAGHPLADAGAKGVARALSHEWRNAGITVSSVSLDDASDLNAALALACAHPGKHDLRLHGGKATERIADPHPEIEPPANAELDLDEHSVVLLFGGGVGIAAEVGIDLARRYRSRIVAIGRTPWDEAAPGVQARDDGRAQQAPGTRSQPDAGERQRSLARTAQRVREAGGQFHYLSADLTQPDAVEAVIEHASSQLGRIDMVIHAAGVVEDRGLGAKPVDSFLRVFRTKAHSALHLRSVLTRHTPKYIVFFSSLVSHTGNAGQTDYCAGNEVLNAMAAELASACPDSRVVSLLWSVWHETGLANRAVQQRMAQLGMSGIGNADGTRRFHAELSRPTVPDWLLISCPRMLEVMQANASAT